MLYLYLNSHPLLSSFPFSYHFPPFTLCTFLYSPPFSFSIFSTPHSPPLHFPSSVATKSISASQGSLDNLMDIDRTDACSNHDPFESFDNLSIASTGSSQSIAMPKWCKAVYCYTVRDTMHMVTHPPTTHTCTHQQACFLS